MQYETTSCSVYLSVLLCIDVKCEDTVHCLDVFCFCSCSFVRKACLFFFKFSPQLPSGCMILLGNIFLHVDKSHFYFISSTFFCSLTLLTMNNNFLMLFDVRSNLARYFSVERSVMLDAFWSSIEHWGRNFHVKENDLTALLLSLLQNNYFSLHSLSEASFYFGMMPSISTFHLDLFVYSTKPSFYSMKSKLKNLMECKQIWYE